MLAPYKHTDVVAIDDTELRRWLRDQDWRRWEREFDEDMRAGTLDILATESGAFREIGWFEELQ